MKLTTLGLNIYIYMHMNVRVCALVGVLGSIDVLLNLLVARMNRQKNTHQLCLVDDRLSLVFKLSVGACMADVRL